MLQGWQNWKKWYVLVLLHCCIRLTGIGLITLSSMSTMFHCKGAKMRICCCSLCCVRALLQSPCRVLWKLCYTPQALSLFPESWHSVLCLPLCLCPFLLVYCPPVYINCSGLGTFLPVSFPPLQVSSFALLPLISVSFLPLQSPWCSVTQGPFESCF